MIEYRPRRKARREDTMERLRAIAVSPQSAAADLMNKVQREAESLAGTMAEIHGGRWNIRINHDRCLLLIAREIG